MSRYNSIAVLRSIFCTVRYQEGRSNCGYLYGTADLKIKYWSIRVDVCQMNTNWHRVSVTVTRMARSGSESVSAQLGGFRDRNCRPSLSQPSTGLAACEHPRRRSWRSGVEARKSRVALQNLTGTQGPAQLEVLSTVINMPFDYSGILTAFARK